jgi:hypothetical protein
MELCIQMPLRFAKKSQTQGAAAQQVTGGEEGWIKAEVVGSQM